MKSLICPHCSLKRSFETGYTIDLNVGVSCTNCKKLIFPAKADQKAKDASASTTTTTKSDQYNDFYTGSNYPGVMGEYYKKGVGPLTIPAGIGP